jgi:hypothetical protein
METLDLIPKELDDDDPVGSAFLDMDVFTVLSDRGGRWYGRRGGGGGTGGGGDGTSGDGSPGGAGTGGGASGPDWDSFIRGMDNLNANLGGKFDALLTEVKSSRPAPAPDPEPEPGDIDAMSNSELSSHIVSRMMKAFEGLLGEKLAPSLPKSTT